MAKKMSQRTKEEVNNDILLIYQRQPDKRKITIESDKTKIDRLLKEMREITGE